ncbi:MAG: DUF3524 domain-containing protein [candidate division Zixibacteria bacterium]|nr:DUF3524 domain-containing protein [candidate division Zixibacteria bacterium]
MKILALEPYYGGSHRAFLDGWAAASRHDWTILGLPAYKWKWRMRHSAVTLARQVTERYDTGERWDRLFCSDMLNLAEFKGLVDPGISALPAVLYFHENQLTYPNRRSEERDMHFAYTNFTSALAADSVWFNSGFHREEFLTALRGLLERMPDYEELSAVDRIREKSAVHPPGITPLTPPENRRPGPPRILWAARWDHDKNPELFFDVVMQLAQENIDFRVSVIGEQFSDVPPVFAQARKSLGTRIDRWGYQTDRRDYEAALREADIVVSTANHEFFGIGVVEAIASGAYPLLPNRLAYPEILADIPVPERASFFYDGSHEQLKDRLRLLIAEADVGTLWTDHTSSLLSSMKRFTWNSAVPVLDDSLESSLPL